jgi:hypothetical protein
VVLRTATTVNFNADWPGRYGRQGGAEAGTRTPRPAETLCCGRSPLRRFGCGRVGFDEPTLIGCLPSPRYLLDETRSVRPHLACPNRNEFSACENRNDVVALNFRCLTDENYCATVLSGKVRMNSVYRLNDNIAAAPDYVASEAERYRLQRSTDLRRLLAHVTATILLAISLAIAAWLLLHRPTAQQDSSPPRVRAAARVSIRSEPRKTALAAVKHRRLQQYPSPADRFSRAVR